MLWKGRVEKAVNANMPMCCDMTKENNRKVINIRHMRQYLGKQSFINMKLCESPKLTHLSIDIYIHIRESCMRGLWYYALFHLNQTLYKCVSIPFACCSSSGGHCAFRTTSVSVKARGQDYLFMTLGGISSCAMWFIVDLPSISFEICTQLFTV